MSEELSRVKSRQKKVARKAKPATIYGSGDAAASGSAPPSAPTRSNRPGELAQPLSEPLSRKGRRAVAPSKDLTERGGTGNSEGTTPSRAQSYPSERIRLSKMFVNSLIVIFVVLLGFLLWWGIEGAPPLKELW